MVTADPVSRDFERGMCNADPMTACFGVRWYLEPIEESVGTCLSD